MLRCDFSIIIASVTYGKYAVCLVCNKKWRLIIIVTLKGASRDFLQCLHCTVSCVQCIRSSGPGAIVCKSCATHRALIMSGMSIFFFSAEFRFFFLLSAFLEIIFRFFGKIRRKKIPTLPLLGEFKKLRPSLASSFACTRFFRFRSKYENAVCPLDTRNLTLKKNSPVTNSAGCLEEGEGRVVEVTGWIATVPASVL